MKNYILSIALLAAVLVANGQKSKMHGLWAVESVKVGEENMTPVAKWFQFNPDNTYQSGNGWLQSAHGVWSYNKQKNTFFAYDSLDIADQAGDFMVAFEAGKMTWEREEEGMPVKVTLTRAEAKPMSPADYLEGVWELVEENGEQASTERTKKLFIRWDRIFVDVVTGVGRRTGYWHIHGHRSEITLLPHQIDREPESWRVEVDRSELIMTGISDTNRDEKRRYVRRRSL